MGWLCTVQQSPAVDIVFDLNVEPLPFSENSVDHIYSSHTFEHLGNFKFIFKEIMRVCKHDALVEIWTPYGKSNDAFIFGHTVFFTEIHYRHICYEHDRFYLGDYKGYFLSEKSHYVLWPEIVTNLEAMGISLEFALEHLFNIAFEWGVFLRVKKDADRSPAHQRPERFFGYSRDSAGSLVAGTT